MVMSENDTRQNKSQHSIKLPYLYKEGSKILQAYAERKGSLKSLVYATRQDRLYKRLLALVCRAVDNQAAVDAALASVGLLTAEPGLAPSTARLLTAELLFGTGQLGSEARPALTVLRYADRLRAAAAADGAERAAGSAADRRLTLPRYARINTLLASVDDVINQLTAEGWERVQYSPEVTYDQFITQVKSLSEGQFLLDVHVPCLLVFPPGTELHQHQLYRRGQLVLQDKASCLPPVVLAPSPGEHVIDACSAPGMKTSQLAAMMNNRGSLVAVERDRGRFQILSAMLKKAGANNTRLMNRDFMKLKPEDYPRVTAILLDPSCSGTGMVSREPEAPPSEERLRRLSNLQGMLLRHALSFPAVRRVVYSTCSVTEDENEQVVAATLAAHPGWRLAAAAPATWRGRGRTTLDGGERCIRADPAADLCHGFFVAAFEKVDGGTTETVETSGKKIKNKKQKRSGDRQGKAGAVSVEVGGGKKKPCSDETVGVRKTDGVQDEGPRKKKKKRKRSETAESVAAGAMSLEERGGKKRQSSSEPMEAEKSDGVPDGGPRKKKKREQNEATGAGALRDTLIEANGKKASSGRSEAPKPEVASCDAPVGTGEKKKKKKRRRSGSDEKEETDTVSSKGDRSEGTCVDASKDKKAKKHTKSGRLSKRRRMALKGKKPAAILTK